MTMISDLPHDLESEILSKVPAKSLEKLKSTCKRWYTLFKDPRFIEKNNSGSEAAREVILLMNSIVYSIRINVHGIHLGVYPSVNIYR
ncbi:putative F-box protein At3g17270 [Eutrema salsugineum]|uniref:putative F-box protein At3g17270 n=1 Tax=Eutrema salsugineum TaxID=72664 RepID=UPI000CED594F|nr:putative F-box protein At3g17270 [Eutrema salsugineum]